MHFDLELIHQTQDGCKTTVSTTDLFHILGSLQTLMYSNQELKGYTPEQRELICDQIRAFRTLCCSKIK